MYEGLNASGGLRTSVCLHCCPLYRTLHIPDICHFFTQTRIFENKIYTEERVNYDKRISRQNSVNQDLLDQVNNKDQDHEKKGRFGFSSLSFLVTTESALLAPVMKCHLLDVS